MTLFEGLEPRELLSGAVSHLRPTAEVAILAKKAALSQTIKGSASGMAIGVSGSNLAGVNSLVASGSASSLGSITVAGEVNYRFKGRNASYSNGDMTIVGSGGQIYISFSGSGKRAGATKSSLTLKGTIKGGSGAYAGATGTFTGKLNADSDSYGLSMSFTLKRTS